MHVTADDAARTSLMIYLFADMFELEDRMQCRAGSLPTRMMEVASSGLSLLFC